MSKRDMACCLQQWRRASQIAARCQQYAHTLTYEEHTGTMEHNQRYMKGSARDRHDDFMILRYTTVG